MSARDLVDADEMTSLEAWQRAFLARLEVRGYAATTVTSMRSALDVFQAWCAERGLTEPAEVTPPMLERYQRHLFYRRRRDGRLLSLRTQVQRLTHVRSFFRFLARERVVLYNPAADLELPRLPAPLPKDVLKADEAEAILASVDIGTAKGLRDRTVLELFYATGLRRIEVARLDVFDIDFDRRWLTVRRGKGGHGRVVPIGDRAAAWLERYISSARVELLFPAGETALFLSVQGGRLTEHGLSAMVNKRIRESGVRERGGCHLFRHTMATLMLENGADLRFIQEMLGHSSVETTQVYTRVSIRQLEQIHAATHPAARHGRRQADEPSD